jgi:hypothetical protein
MLEWFCSSKRLDQGIEEGLIVKDDLKNEKSGECVVKEESLGVRG